MVAVVRSLSLLLLLSAPALPTLAQEREPLRPPQTLAGLVVESAALQKAMNKYLRYTYRGGEQVLVGRAFQERGVWYQPFLKDLVEVPRASPSIAKWVDRLVGHAQRLKQLFEEGGSRAALRDQFYLTHQAYWKSLAAFYCLAEEEVQWYLGPRATQPVNRRYEDRRYAADLVRWLDAGHEAAQKLMGLMNAVRTEEGYEALSPHHYFKETFLFESLYGRFYHAGERMSWDGKRPRNLGVYFYPYLYPHLTPRDLAPMPETGDANADAREYALIQELFERNPALRDNEALRSRLAELQSRKEAPSTPSPGRPGEEPPAVRDNPELQRLILQMQNLLGSAEIKRHPATRAAIERFLSQIRPGLPPLKPLPPPPAEETPGPPTPPSPMPDAPSTPDRITRLTSTGR